MLVKIVDDQIGKIEPVTGHPDPVGAPGKPGVDGIVDRAELVKRLREVAARTPPICHHDETEEIEVFGKRITVYCKPFEQFQFLLKMAANAIEAEPVRHGRWEFKHPNGWACSECGEWGLMIDNRGICKSNYCPNCGAKMDALTLEEASRKLGQQAADTLRKLKEDENATD